MTHPESRTLAPITTAKRFMTLALAVVLQASCASFSQATPTSIILPRLTAVAPTFTVAPASTPEEVEADDIPVAIEDSESVSPSTSTIEDTYTANGQIVSPTTSTAKEVGTDDILISIADGYIADGENLSAFDTDYPAISNLDPALLAAVQQAYTDAANDGVEMFITSGWRSVRYQQALLDEAVVTYGSLAEARRWVNTPERSTHVTGLAVDIGPTDADSWLSQHGNDYGLCQTFANEMWHFELATTPGGTCPQQISDASAG